MNVLLKAAKDPFRGTGNMNAKKLRKHLLGRVVIPKINVNVPLFNLTTADTLNYGAAVLQGSSFPTGGKGKRTVIAAHRGLPERKLFTDLDKVKKGDLFVISVYGKNMAYKVYNIKVIKPNKVKSLLPVKDKDLATLMTCTPYMINSHRMLVTGYRVPYTKKIAREVEGASLMNNLIQAAVMLGCVMAIFSVFYILYRIIHGGLLKSARSTLISSLPMRTENLSLAKLSSFLPKTAGASCIATKKSSSSNRMNRDGQVHKSSRKRLLH